MFDHQDRLNPLDQNIGLTKKLEYIHGALKERFPFISRIAAAMREMNGKRSLRAPWIYSSFLVRPIFWSRGLSRSWWSNIVADSLTAGPRCRVRRAPLMIG